MSIRYFLSYALDYDSIMIPYILNRNMNFFLFTLDLEYNTAGHSMVTVKKSNNDELSQSCKISGVPNPTYKWQDPKGAVIETERILSTRINNEADYGNYSCVARSEQAGVNLTFIVEVVKKEGGNTFK